MEDLAYLPAFALLTSASFATQLPPCITQRTIFSQAAPSETVNMIAPTIKNTSSAPGGKQETAKQWLQRRLRKLPSIQPTNARDGGLCERISIKRPRTAPSSGTTMDTSEMPAMPSIPINVQPPLHTSSIQPPPRPPRPNSGIMRDVNAWLDASMSTPSPPLMGGVSYWKSATVANAIDTAGIQHAIPIVQKAELTRPSMAHSQQVKSFRRRARKIHVQMPMLARNKSHRAANRKQVNRRSNSMPVFGIPYEATQQATPPRLLMRTRSFLNPTIRAVPVKPPADSIGGSSIDEPPLEQLRSRNDSPGGVRTSETEGSMERRMNALFGRSTRSADSTRPSTAAAHITREDSMGDLSDAPTYFSGPPPPSYRSRPTSVLTTSSFGCIDGMNLAQRQISQQRAALQRGMKGKLKRFAHTFTA